MSAGHNRKRSSLTQMRLASIGALSITLTVLGIIALVRILATSLEKSVKEQVHFSIELPANFTEDSYKAISSNIYNIKGIKQLEFVSADSALQQIAPDLGEDPRALLGYNPLSPIIRLEIESAYLNTDSLRKIERALVDIGLEAQLQYDEAQLKSLDKNLDSAEWVLWGFVILQGLFAFIQINNTVRMMIYADRFQIRTLTLVGASSWFIKRPIVWRSICDGIISSVLSLLIVSALVYGLHSFFGVNVISLLSWNALLIAVVGLFLVAVCASALAAVRATSRYIQMDGRRIYLI